MAANAIARFISYLSTVIIVIVVILVLKATKLVRWAARSVRMSGHRVINRDHYLCLIEENSPTSLYKEESARRECAVCLSEFDEGESIRELKCKHVFHKNCLDKWLQQYRSTCPLCRTKILPDEVVDSYQRLQNLNQREIDNWSQEETFLLLLALHGNSLHGLVF